MALEQVPEPVLLLRQLLRALHLRRGAPEDAGHGGRGALVAAVDPLSEGPPARALVPAAHSVGQRAEGQGAGPWGRGGAGLPLRGGKEKTFVTPTERNVHGDALCCLVMGLSLLERLAVGGWRLVVVSGWQLVVVGGGWQLAVGGGWRLAVGGG